MLDEFILILGVQGAEYDQADGRSEQGCDASDDKVGGVGVGSGVVHGASGARGHQVCRAVYRRRW